MPADITFNSSASTTLNLPEPSLPEASPATATIIVASPTLSMTSHPHLAAAVAAHHSSITTTTTTTSTSCPSTGSLPPTSTPRRGKPANVQTSFPHSIASTPPPSAMSASSVTTASSVQVSPVMSPETLLITTNNSSIQPSPDGPRGREADLTPPPFELPESIVSRKSSRAALHDTMGKSPGLIRRLSNRASQFAGRRRQSSATAALSRDHSQGPITMRRRSDSTNTNPEGGKTPFSYDSDEDVSEDVREDASYQSTQDAHGDAMSLNSTAASSVSTGNLAPIGPVIPSSLLEGTTMIKVNKKRNKLLTFVLESEAAKVTWDKSRPSKSFYIDNIKDIRFGPDAQNYRKEFGIQPSEESRFFSIVYTVPEKSRGRSQKVMHLIANDDSTFDLWTSTLDAISKHRQDLMASLSSFHEKAVRSYWRTEMNKQFMDKPHKEDEEEMDITEVERLCRALHIFTTAEDLAAKFKEADVLRSGRLNFTEIQEFVKLMKSREDVVAIYNEVAAEPEKGLTLDEFLAFLRNRQFEDVDSNRQHWESIFAKFVRRSKSKEQLQKDNLEGEVPRMNAAALTSYLTSNVNVPFESAPPKYSLDRPLNEYYISSSHNTYLMSRQVAGQSNAEAYISALLRGCRCVEVDCWNGADGPVVMHGRTLTTQVSFALVMNTISTYAFVKTPFPLIISLEVHCNPQQQAQMAEIMKETFGSMLVTEPLDPSSDQLPSPSQLLRRILIKVKQPRGEAPVEITGRSRGNSQSSPYLRPLILENMPVPSVPLPPNAYHRSARVPRAFSRHSSAHEGQESLSSGTSDSESLVEDIAKAKESNAQNKTSNIIKVLGELGVYAAGFKFHGFDAPECKQPNHIFSFMEQTFDNRTKSQDEKRALSRHNMRYLMRVYPNRWRVASNNFDPLKYWRRGVQMVALNWQTYDLGMQLNHAMFAAGTDQSGYVLKPVDLREFKMLPQVPEEAGTDHVKRERKNVTFSIQVKSAQQLIPPKNLPSNREFLGTYVEVEVYHADDKSKESKGVVGEGGQDASAKDGSSGLGAPHRRRTHIVRGNSFNPVFGEEFHFELTTKYPELVFVRWTVRCSTDGETYSDRGHPLATYTAKLTNLKKGYRTLPLFDNEGDKFLFSTLFCHIKIEPFTSIYVNSPETTSENVGVLKSIGRTVWRSTPMSPKPADGFTS